MGSTDHVHSQTAPAPGRTWVGRAVVAVVLVVAGCLLALSAPGSFEGVEVAIDGEPHEVEVSAYTSTVVFIDRAGDEPQCAVADPDTGGVYPLAPSSRSAAEDARATGDDVGWVAFTPATETVVVTCTGSGGVVTLAAENPSTPYLVARYGGAGVLVLGGLALLASAVVVARRRLL